MAIPARLQQILDDLSDLAGSDLHSQYLIELAEDFSEVPADIARRPFLKENLVPGCESEAYIWSRPDKHGTLKYYFAVENPQGISAKAMAVILDQSFSGADRTEIAEVPQSVVYEIFGRGLSMGKGQGLMGMLGTAKALANPKFG